MVIVSAALAAWIGVVSWQDKRTTEMDTLTGMDGKIRDKDDVEGQDSKQQDQKTLPEETITMK